MPDVRDITITELDAAFAHCKRFNGATFDNYTSEALSRVGTGTFMWQDTADVMYWGAAAAFNYIGFRLHTAGDYAALDWEYWNGAAWTNFTPVYDGTTNFSENGYIIFGSSVLTGWASTTVDSQAAFWIRAGVGTVTTAAKFYSFLRNVTLGKPLKIFKSDNPNLKDRDVTGTLQVRDQDYKGPLDITIECTLKAQPMPELSMMHHWQKLPSRLHIEDHATTVPANPEADSFISAYEGMLANVDSNASAAYKMNPMKYMLKFDIDTVTTIFDS